MGEHRIIVARALVPGPTLSQETEARLQLLSALLDACGDIPDFDEVQKTDRGHWENRIKTPLETALDSCVRAGVLDGWEYCGAKKAKLSDSEVDIGDYATFIGLYVRFRMGRMNDED